MLAYVWQRFLFLSWIGKGVAIGVLLYGLGWVFGNLGAHAAARQLASAGLFVLAFPLAAIVIRWVWRNYTAPPKQR